MKLLTIVVAALLVGCASKPTIPPRAYPAPRAEVLDERCATIGKQVRAIATIRDSGLDQNDIGLLVKRNGVYPVEPLIREVYTRLEVDPITTAITAYNTCRSIGFDRMVAALQRAETAWQGSELQRAQDDATVMRILLARRNRR